MSPKLIPELDVTDLDASLHYRGLVLLAGVVEVLSRFQGWGDCQKTRLRFCSGGRARSGKAPGKAAFGDMSRFRSRCEVVGVVLQNPPVLARGVSGLG